MSAAYRSCLHCQAPVPTGAAGDARFCCGGCEAVHALLHQSGLERYYHLRQGPGIPVSATRDAVSTGAGMAWLHTELERTRNAAQRSSGLLSLEVDVQGLHCAACVWLLERLFERRPGAGRILVNPALGKLSLTFRDGVFDVADYLRELERFGYRTGPASARSAGVDRGLIIRIGIAAALAMNTMVFAIAIYAGLGPEDGAFFDMVNAGGYLLGTLSVLVGGPVFFRGALGGLRRGLLHLDLPISVGIVLAWVGSAWSFHVQGGAHSYFDSLSIFILLMLLGRWLQEHLLWRNQRMLLQDESVENLTTRRLNGAGAVEMVPLSALRVGDELLVPPGELVPLDGLLDSEEACISTDWVSGESRPQQLSRGAALTAGSFNAGRQALRLRADRDFRDSTLPALLRDLPQSGAQRGGQLWDRVARLWVATVLLLAGAGFAWHGLMHGWQSATQVAVALLVVTCPCALGLAAPLAHELILSSLRSRGVFVRDSAFLELAPRLREVVFDKTGTLTLGRLELSDAEALGALNPAARNALGQMVLRSSHPVSRALARALEAITPIAMARDAQVQEHAGQGLSYFAEDGSEWRLGRASFALEATSTRSGTLLARDGVAVACFELNEALRPDTREEVAALQAAGLRIHLLSGDSKSRVDQVAAQLGIPEPRRHAGQQPKQKADFIEALDAGRDVTLMVGDGVNDLQAMQRATCAATPAVDRPFVPGRAQLYFTGEGLAAVRRAIEAARTLARVTRRNLVLAVAYNLLAAGLALAGLLTPLWCAVLMPLSSLSFVALTVFALRPRRGEAHAAACPNPALSPATA